MATGFDAIVVGLGTMGSQTLLQLARAGKRVLGIDRRQPPHTFSSHHGWSRLIRFAYFEHPDYVPLLHQAAEGWTDLESQTGQRLFERCGVVQAGPSHCELIEGIRLSSAQHGLGVGELPSEIRSRIPFRLPESWSVLWEPRAGYLYPEACVAAAISEALRFGAQVIFDAEVDSIGSLVNSVEVQSGYHRWISDRVVLTAGAHAGRWSSLSVAKPTVLRKHLFWFAPRSTRWNLSQGCPAFLFDTGSDLIYGFPAFDERGVKIARHDGGAEVSPDSQDTEIGKADELGSLGRFIENFTEDLDLAASDHAICRYAMSDDSHFRLGTSPDERVIWASCFSGHGFKFAPSIGRQLAQRLLTGKWSPEVRFLVKA